MTRFKILPVPNLDDCDQDRIGLAIDNLPACELTVEEVHELCSGLNDALKAMTRQRIEAMRAKRKELKVKP